MTADELLRFYESAGFCTHRSPSALWYEAGPRFWLASPSHTAVAPPSEELAEVMRATRAIGLRYISSDLVGARASFQMAASGADYSLDRLAANARSKIRRGLKRHEIRRIEGAELKDAGRQAFVETLARQERDKAYPFEKWHRLLDASDRQPDVEIWSAWYGKELASYLMVFLIDDICELYQARSRNSLLKHYPNNALVFFLTEEMLVRRGLREVTYGIESLEETASVDAFKLSMGYVKKPVAQRVVFRRSVDVALKTPGVARGLDWLGSRPSAPSALRKARGLIRFAGLAGPGQATGLPPAIVFPDNLAALALARELGAAGVPVHVLHHDSKGPATRSRFAQRVDVPDFYRDPKAWVEHACKLADGFERTPIVFPTEDAAMLVLERYHERLSGACAFPYAAPGVVERIADKRELYRQARESGLDVPDYHEIASEDDARALPSGDWLIKPSCRYAWNGDRIHTFLSISGGAKAMQGDPVVSARRLLAAGFPTIAQERIPGDHRELVSVACVVAPDGTLLDSFASRKVCEYPEPFGDGLIVDLIADPGVVEQAHRLLREFGYWGICDLEFKRDPRDDRFKLLDANPRAWLWMSLGTVAGHSLAVAAYNLVAGEQQAEPLAGSTNLGRWVSGRGAAAFMLKCYKPRRHGWTLPLKLAVGAASTAMATTRAFGDPIFARPPAWRALLTGAAQPRRRREDA